MARIKTLSKKPEFRRSGVYRHGKIQEMLEEFWESDAKYGEYTFVAGVDYQDATGAYDSLWNAVKRFRKDRGLPKDSIRAVIDRDKVYIIKK